MYKYFIFLKIVILKLDALQKFIICNVYNIFCFAKKKVSNAIMVNIFTVLKLFSFMLSKKCMVMCLKYQELLQKPCNFSQIIGRN